jgi:hypothetical protein
MRSVCFFMVYHNRPSVTAMSVHHMADVIDLFNDEGFDAVGIVIGDSAVIERTAKHRGLMHERHPNDPVSGKFTYAWMLAAQENKDYICWLGSNNMHSDGYWELAMERLRGNKVATFGSRNCVIMSANPEVTATCHFKPRDHYLISSGQFFLTYSFVNAVNILTVYDLDQQFNFDGKVLDKMTDMWGKEIIEYIEFDEEDCIDVKTDFNIHSYESYMKLYPEYLPSNEIIPRFPRLMMLMKGFYD